MIFLRPTDLDAFYNRRSYIFSFSCRKARKKKFETSLSSQSDSNISGVVNADTEARVLLPARIRRVIRGMHLAAHMARFWSLASEGVHQDEMTDNGIVRGVDTSASGEPLDSDAANLFFCRHCSRIIVFSKKWCFFRRLFSGLVCQRSLVWLADWFGPCRWPMILR